MLHLIRRKQEMNFDEYFNEQSKFVKILLLAIPFVGWVVEVIVRLSVVIKRFNQTNLVGFIFFFLIGWLYLPTIVDLIFLTSTDRLILVE